MTQPTSPNRTLDLASIQFSDVVSRDQAPAVMGDLIWTAPETLQDEAVVFSFESFAAAFRAEAPAGAILSSLDAGLALAA